MFSYRGMLYNLMVFICILSPFFQSSWIYVIDRKSVQWKEPGWEKRRKDSLGNCGDDRIVINNTDKQITDKFAPFSVFPV